FIYLTFCSPYDATGPGNFLLGHNGKIRGLSVIGTGESN
ncbi:unnamed protein product, partial [Allacma fusca]